MGTKLELYAVAAVLFFAWDLSGKTGHSSKNSVDLRDLSENKVRFR